MKYSSETVVRSSGSDRVLVIMAKAPRPGAVKTRLAPSLSPEAVTSFYCCLLEDTLALARSLGQRTMEATISSGQRLLILRFSHAMELAPAARWRDSWRARELLSYP